MTDLLFMTVGLGEREDPETSLYQPMERSVRNEDWSRVFLLPSQGSLDKAETLEERLAPLPVLIRVLPAEGDENDVDRCFAHFDSCIQEVLDGGARQSDLALDFTRGTKAMSAAAVLAAVRRGVGRFVYVTGPRGAAGNVLPGQEEVRRVEPDRVRWALRQDDARMLMRQGLFRAAGRLLREGDAGSLGLLPQEQRLSIEGLQQAAAFFAAWDRLDYKAAAGAPAVRETCGAAVVDWVVALAADQPNESAEAARRLRLLAVDLLANGERRVAAGQYEDALIRAYRVLELIGQARLFDRCYDSAAIPFEDEKVTAFVEDLGRKKRNPPGNNRAGDYQLAREQVARFLKYLGDPLGSKLLGFPDKNRYLDLKNRNLSVLIHGFEAINPNEEAPFRQVFQALNALLLEDDAGAAERLALVRDAWPR